MSKKHIFLSYCRVDQEDVKELRSQLIEAGENVWWDQDIMPGSNWQSAIKEALRDSYAVIACFSEESSKRFQAGIYPEIRDAIAEYRTYAPGAVFLFPVRLSESKIPELKIDDTTTLRGCPETDFVKER